MARYEDTIAAIMGEDKDEVQASSTSTIDAIMGAGKQEGGSSTIDAIMGISREKPADKGTDLVKLGKLGARGMAESFTTELPGMAGKAFQWAMPEPIKSALGHPGKALADWADRKAVEWYGDAPENLTMVERAVYEGTKMFAPSIVPGGLIGTGTRAILGVGNLVKAAKLAAKAGDAVKAANLMAQANKGAKLAVKVAGIGSAGFFGASQAQETADNAIRQADRLEAQGKHDEAAQMRKKAEGIAPWLTGGIEATGEYFGTKYLAKLFRLDHAIVDERMAGKLVTDFLKTLGVETGTEYGQMLGQAVVEKEMGIRPEAHPFAEALDVIPPTVVMTMLTGGFGAAYQKARRDDDAPPPTGPPDAEFLKNVQEGLASDIITPEDARQAVDSYIERMPDANPEILKELDIAIATKQDQIDFKELEDDINVNSQALLDDAADPSYDPMDVFDEPIVDTIGPALEGMYTDAAKRAQTEEDPWDRNMAVAEVKEIQKAMDRHQAGEPQNQEALELYPELAKLFPDQVEKKKPKAEPTEKEKALEGRGLFKEDLEAGKKMLAVKDLESGETFSYRPQKGIATHADIVEKHDLDPDKVELGFTDESGEFVAPAEEKPKVSEPLPKWFDKDQQEFIDKKVAELGSIEKVKEVYTKDDKVTKYAHQKAEELYGEKVEPEKKAEKKPWEFKKRDYAEEPGAMAVPKDSIFAIDPEKTTEDDLKKYKNKELEELAYVLKLTQGGNKAAKVKRIKKAMTLKRALKNTTPEGLVKDHTSDELSDLLKDATGKPATYLNKKGKAAKLMKWVADSDQAAKTRISGARHYQEVKTAVERGDPVPDDVLESYAQDRIDWAEKEWERRGHPKIPTLIEQIDKQQKWRPDADHQTFVNFVDTLSKDEKAQVQDVIDTYKKGDEPFGPLLKIADKLDKRAELSKISEKTAMDAKAAFEAKELPKKPKERRKARKARKLSDNVTMGTWLGRKEVDGINFGNYGRKGGELEDLPVAIKRLSRKTGGRGLPFETFVEAAIDMGYFRIGTTDAQVLDTMRTDPNFLQRRPKYKDTGEAIPEHLKTKEDKLHEKWLNQEEPVPEWSMTKEDYRKDRREDVSNFDEDGQISEEVMAAHKESVQEALDKGWLVEHKDYPELKPTVPTDEPTYDGHKAKYTGEVLAATDEDAIHYGVEILEGPEKGETRFIEKKEGLRESEEGYTYDPDIINKWVKTDRGGIGKVVAFKDHVGYKVVGSERLSKEMTGESWPSHSPFEWGFDRKDLEIIERPPRKKAKIEKEVIDPNGMYVRWDREKTKEVGGITSTTYQVFNKDGSFKAWRTATEIERIKEAKGKKILTLDQGTLGKQTGMTRKARKTVQQGLGLVDKTKGDLFPEAPAEKIGDIEYVSGLEKLNALKGAIDAEEPMTILAGQVAKTTIYKGQKPAYMALVNYAQRGGIIMVDSGAFPAFKYNLKRAEAIEKGKKVPKFPEGAFIKQKDGTAKVDWDQVITWMEDFIKDSGGGDNITFVAPDIVGDQAVTFKLQQKHGPRFNKMWDPSPGQGDGVRIMLPIQLGDMSPSQAWTLGTRLLEVGQVTVGIPSNQNDFSDADVESLMTESKMRPSRVHFLGATTRTPALAGRIDIVREANPEAFVTFDATSKWRTQVGRPKAGPKPITKRRDELKQKRIEEEEERTWDMVQDLYTDPEEFLGSITAKEMAYLEERWGSREEWNIGFEAGSLEQDVNKIASIDAMVGPKEGELIPIWFENQGWDFDIGTLAKQRFIDEARLGGEAQRQAFYEGLKGKLDKKKDDDALYSLSDEGATGRHGTRSWIHLDKKQKAAVTRHLAEIPDGKEIGKRLKKLRNTDWERMAIEEILIERALFDVLDGKTPDFKSKLDGIYGAKPKALIKRRGWEGLWDYVEGSNTGLLGAAAKPVNTFNGAYKNCDPTKDCAMYCYGTEGRYPLASIMVKGTINNMLVERDPVRAGILATRFYKKTLEGDHGKALRIFDRGDGSDAYATAITEMNRRGITTQVFSRKPEFLKQLSMQHNQLLLSIDRQNRKTADDNPDLPIAFIYGGASKADVKWLDGQRGRYEKYGGTIFLIEQGKKVLPKSERAKLPKWAQKYVCVFDRGVVHIKSNVHPEGWTCTKCDKDGGTGCFHGRVSAKLRSLEIPLHERKDLDAYIEEVRETADKLKDADRIQFLGELDLLLSQVRRGIDPETAEGVEGRPGRTPRKPTKPGKPPKYQIGKTVPVIGDKPLLDVIRKSPMFQNKNVTTGLSSDGTAWVRTRAGQGVTFESVDHISPNKAVVKIHHGEMLDDGKFIKGKYLDGKIELQRDTADEWTVTHESIHWAEDLGFINARDVSILRTHIRKQQQAGKWNSEKREVGGVEDRAIYATKFMKDRTLTGPVAKVLQKIRDFIDMIVNVFHRTARGVMRDIESGKVLGRRAGRIGLPVRGYQQAAERWYSQMTNVLQAKLPGKGTGKSFAQTIEAFARKGEFKGAEMEWTGVLDWLKSKSGKVTKQDVIDYMAENNVVVKEVRLGPPTHPETVKKIQDSIEYLGEKGYKIEYAPNIVTGDPEPNTITFPANILDSYMKKDEFKGPQPLGELMPSDLIPHDPKAREAIETVRDAVYPITDINDWIGGRIEESDMTWSLAEYVEPSGEEIEAEYEYYMASLLEEDREEYLDDDGTVNNTKLSNEAYDRAFDSYNHFGINTITTEQQSGYYIKFSNDGVYELYDDNNNFIEQMDLNVNLSEAQDRIAEILVERGLSVSLEDIEEAEDRIGTQEDTWPSTRHERYSEPGGVRSRELLLTLAPRPTPKTQEMTRLVDEYLAWSIEHNMPAMSADELIMEVRDQSDILAGAQVEDWGVPRADLSQDPLVLASQIAYLEDFIDRWETMEQSERSVTDEAKFLAGLDMENWNDLGPNGRQRYEDEARRKLQPQKRYTSGHWEDPDVVVHIRFDERTGPDGEKILHIAEIQSDWHQEGRKKGYGRVLPPGYSVVKTKDGKMWSIINSKGNAEGHFGDTKQEALDTFFDSGTKLVGVPDAPFKKTWPMLAIKRMVRYAAENGFDAITWDTGTTQFKRWGSEEIAWERKDSTQWEYYNKKTGESSSDSDLPASVITKHVYPSEYSARTDLQEAREFNPALMEDYDVRPVQGWRVYVKNQTGGIAGGIDLEAEARIRGLLDETKQRVSTKDQFSKLVHEVFARSTEGEAVDKIVDRVWERMQAEDIGTSLPRKEGMEGFYDKILVKDINKFFGKKAWGRSKVAQVDLGSEQSKPFEVWDSDERVLATFETRDEAQAFFDNHPEADSLVSPVPGLELGRGVEQPKPVTPPVPAHYLRVTPEMKDKAINEGMALFALGDLKDKIKGLGKGPKRPQSDVLDDVLPDRVLPRVRGARGITREPLWQRMKDGLDIFVKSYTPGRQFPKMDPKHFGRANEVLRNVLEIPMYSKWKAVTIIEEILAPKTMTPGNYDLFSMKLILDDMIRDMDAEDGPLSKWEELVDIHGEIAFGFKSRDEIQDSLDKLNAKIEKNDLVKTALSGRKEFMDGLRRDLVEVNLLPPSVLEDDRYYHHQVLEYANAKYGTGVGRKDMRVGKKGYQIHRIANVKEFNTHYVESEFEVIAQGIAQLETRKNLYEVNDYYGIAARLKRSAAHKNYVAVVGGPENYATLQDLRNRRAYLVGDGKGLDATDRKAIAELTEQIWELDPTMPARRKMAIGMGKMAEALDADPFSMEEDDIDFKRIKALADAGDMGALTFLKGLGERNKLIRDELGDSFLTWRDLMRDEAPIEGSQGWTGWKPKPGSAWYLTNSLNDRILEQVLMGARELQEEDVRKVLSRGVDVEWVLPAEIAEALDGQDFINLVDDNVAAIFAEKSLNWWKRWILINPARIAKYNINNLSGDADICFAYNPRIFKYAKQAAHDMWKFHYGKEMTPELKAEFDLAVRNSVVGSGMTVHDIPDISEAPQLKKMMEALNADSRSAIRYIERFWEGSKNFTTWRENVLRLASYRFFQDEVRAGKKVYGVSIPEKVDATEDLDRKAALLARELVGDYGGLSKGGQMLRRKMIPFYSWLEINAPRYLRMYKNLAVEGEGSRGRVSRTGAVLGKKGLFLTAKMSFLYAMVHLFNNLFWPDEEDELGTYQRRQLHLILGRRDDGTIVTLRFQGALSDALAWFNLHDAPEDIRELANGTKTIYQWMGEAAVEPFNKMFQGIRPDIKTPGEVITGKQVYPEFWRPRPIRDKWEHVSRLFSAEKIYRRVAGKPIRGDSVAGRVLNDLASLVTYSADPGEAAYHDSRRMVFDFLKAQNVEKPMVDPTNRSNALYYYKQSIKFGDAKAAEKYLQQYKDLGGKLKYLKVSIKRAHPLAGLPKKYRTRFYNRISKEDKVIIRRGTKWYKETYKR
jgi:hypothetical protein